LGKMKNLLEQEGKSSTYIEYLYKERIWKLFLERGTINFPVFMSEGTIIALMKKV